MVKMSTVLLVQAISESAMTFLWRHRRNTVWCQRELANSTASSLRRAWRAYLWVWLGMVWLLCGGCSESATLRQPEDVLLRVDKVSLGKGELVTIEGRLVASGYDRDATLELRARRTAGGVLVTPHVSARKLSGDIRHVSWSFIVHADELPNTVIKGNIAPEGWRDATLLARRIRFDWLQERPDDLPAWLKMKGYSITDEWKFDTSSVSVDADADEQPFATISGFEYYTTIDGELYDSTRGLWRVFANHAEFVEDDSPRE